MKIQISGAANHGGGQRLYTATPRGENSNYSAWSLVARAVGDYPAVAQKSVRIYVRPVIALWSDADTQNGREIADAEFVVIDDHADEASDRTDKSFIAYPENYMHGGAKTAFTREPNITRTSDFAQNLNYPLMAAGQAYGVIIRTEQWNQNNTAKEKVLDSHADVRLEWRLTII